MWALQAQTSSTSFASKAERGLSWRWFYLRSWNSSDWAVVRGLEGSAESYNRNILLVSYGLSSPMWVPWELLVCLWTERKEAEGMEANEHQQAGTGCTVLILPFSLIPPDPRRHSGKRRWRQWPGVPNACIWKACAPCKWRKYMRLIDDSVKSVAINTPWNLGAPWLCPRPGPQSSKKSQRLSLSSFSGHFGSLAFSQAAPEKDNSQPDSDNWIGWLSPGIAVAKTACVVSLRGFRMQPSFLLYPELSRNLHLPGCC